MCLAIDETVTRGSGGPGLLVRLASGELAAIRDLVEAGGLRDQAL